MPTAEQLRSLTAKKVYGHAVREGIEVAVKHQDLGINPAALGKWFQDHPEFSASDVKALTEQGATEKLAEIVEAISKILGVVGVFNLNGRGGQFYRTVNK